MPVSHTFLTKQITATEELIDAYQTAVTALVTGQAQSYTIDTGQSSQTVTKANINDLNSTIDGLYNRLSMLCVRRDGAGSMLVRPAF